VLAYAVSVIINGFGEFCETLGDIENITLDGAPDFHIGFDAAFSELFGYL